MRYPIISEIKESKEMTNAFKGYVHTATVPDGAFFDLKNITTDDYPVMSTRKNRGFVREFTNLQGMIDKDGLVIVDDGRLFINGEEKEISLSNEGRKSITKMGAFLVIFPDKVWYNTKDNTYGNLEASSEIEGTVALTLCNANGQAITWHDASYYQSHSPSEGDYMMTTTNGKTSLKTYSSATGMWVSVATTYFKIEATDLGKDFEKGDGVKITIDPTGWDYSKNIFVNEEDGKRNSNFVVFDKGDNFITVPGLLDNNRNLSYIKVERKTPDIAYVIECMNRLWACSKDGHEIYCCKLGDVKNWNCFSGISTDSWAATVGSDGEWTGAFAYMGYPTFFKDDSITRVVISSQGAHQARDIACKGIQKGSENSLCMVNETLFYKSDNCVCAYDGQFPVSISEPLGDINYKNAVAGAIGNKYYISMESKNGISNFVYSNGLWTKEDSLKIDFFARVDQELYFASDNKLYTAYGSEGDVEKDFKWMAETGPIGYQSSDRKNLSRVNIRMVLPMKSYCVLYAQYDSSGDWEAVWQMNGKSNQAFAVPMKPHRCDHFKLRIEGRGEAKVYGIIRSYTEGSDI